MEKKNLKKIKHDKAKLYFNNNSEIDINRAAF